MENTKRLVSLIAFILLFSHGALACDQAARPIVRISTAETPAEFDLTRSVADLNSMHIDTKSPFPAQYHTDVGGVMSGEVAVDHKVLFDRLTKNNETCIVLKEIDIKLSISPTIFIAKDFQDQSCWFKTIFEHETKHVETDRALMMKYEGRFNDAMNMMLMMPADYTSGWLDKAGADAAQYNMQEGIASALKVVFDKMMHERAEKQQAIDSLSEYKGISNACPRQVSS